MTAQLQTLLRLRQYEVDRCQSRLAAAVLHERTLAHQLQDLSRQQEQQQAELSALTQHGHLNIEALQLRQRHRQFLAEQRISLQAEFEAAATATQENRASLVAADQQRQVVEKLRERVAQAAQTQLRRTEARELEEAWRAPT
ncbi:MAG: hypothetical protein V4719_01130 [Planctomycetota bacterium]